MDQNTGKCLAFLGECAQLGNPTLSKIHQKTCSSLKGSRTLVTGLCRKLCSVTFIPASAAKARGKLDLVTKDHRILLALLLEATQKPASSSHMNWAEVLHYSVPVKLLLMLNFQIGRGLSPLSPSPLSAGVCGSSSSC